MFKKSKIMGGGVIRRLSFREGASVDSRKKSGKKEETSKQLAACLHIIQSTELHLERQPGNEAVGKAPPKEIP